MYKATRMAFVDLSVEPLDERGSNPFTNLSCMASTASPTVKHLTWSHGQAQDCMSCVVGVAAKKH